MDGTRGRWIGVGVLATALLISGLLVGISYGGGVTEPTVVELTSGKVLKEGADQVREVAKDVDGTRVGKIRWNCDPGIDWHCTIVYSLLPGDHTGRGTVVATGIFGGFNGERLALTGGTGAYANAQGFLVLAGDGGELRHTLHLLP